MPSGNVEHIFIFHGDDEQRPSSIPTGEVVIAGKQGEEKNVPGGSKRILSEEETNSIQMRSACLHHSISSNVENLTHFWPDPHQGINMSILRHVVNNLSAKELHWQGTDKLEELSGICITIWSLKCVREPFAKAANTVLQSRKGDDAKLQDVERLMIIAFVLGQDGDLKKHLSNWIWSSNKTLNCPIKGLRNWINAKREKKLGQIYTFLQEEISQIRINRMKVASGPVAKIYSNLTENADQSGIGINFRYGWLTHLTEKTKLLQMSPEELIDNVLRNIKGEIKGDGVYTESDGASSLNVEVACEDTSKPNGLKSGEGGDFLEFFNALIKPPRNKDVQKVETRAIQELINNTEVKRKMWKELKQEDIKDLIEWRNTKQRKWNTGYLVLNQMNGHTIGSNNIR